MVDHVRPGQTWADNDKRCQGRKLRVERIEGEYAYCKITAEAPQEIRRRAQVERPDGWTSIGLEARIRLDRFEPTSNGYRLETEA